MQPHLSMQTHCYGVLLGGGGGTLRVHSQQNKQNIITGHHLSCSLGTHRLYGSKLTSRESVDHDGTIKVHVQSRIDFKVRSIEVEQGSQTVVPIQAKDLERRENLRTPDSFPAFWKLLSGYKDVWCVGRDPTSRLDGLGHPLYPDLAKLPRVLGVLYLLDL